MTTRTGKIARLPRNVRDQLNRHLDDGAQGAKLLKWLNSLPEVQTMLRAHFNNQPINKQNLSDWKQGGFRDWLLQQEALELAMCMAGDTAALKETAGNAAANISDTMAQWFVTRLLLAAKALVEGGREPIDSDRMRRMLHDLAVLCRGDHHVERIRLARDKFELARKKTVAEKEKEFWERACRPEIPAQIERHKEEKKRRDKESDEKLEKVRKMLFGEPSQAVKEIMERMKATYQTKAAAGLSPSVGVKPGQGQSSLN